MAKFKLHALCILVLLMTSLSHAQFISSVLSTVAGTGASITWNTCTVSDTTVNYGTTTAYGSVASTINSVTAHSQVITGLTAGITYHYQVVSTDSTGVVSKSTDHTFTTLSTVGYSLSVADASNRLTNVRPLQGATLLGNEYIFTSPAGSTSSAPVGIDHVDYTLNGTAVGSDFVTPYDYSNTTSAIAPVQSTNNFVSTAASSIAKAFTTSNILNNLLIVGCGAQGATSIAVTDTQLNAYIAATARAVIATGNSAGYAIQIFFVPNSKAGANTVTCTFNGSVSSRRMVIHEYSGLLTTSPLDVNSSFANTTATSAMTSNSAVTTAAKELVFGWGASNSGWTIPGSGFTIRQTAGSESSEDKIVTVPGSYAATGTSAAADNWVMQMASFKASSVVSALDTTTLANGTYTITQTVTKTDSTTETDSATFNVSNSIVAHSVTLNWTAGSATNIPITFSIYRGTVAGGAKTRIAQSIPSGTLTYKDTAVISGTTYYYDATETDATNVESAHSGEVSALIP